MTVHITAISPTACRDHDRITNVRWLDSSDSTSNTMTTAQAVAWVNDGNKLSVAGETGSARSTSSTPTLRTCAPSPTGSTPTTSSPCRASDPSAPTSDCRGTYELEHRDRPPQRCSEPDSQNPGEDRVNLIAVAWVPDDDPHRPWDEAAELAVRWVDQRSQEQDATAVLVTDTLGRLGVPALEDFERRHCRTSRRGARSRIGHGRGPVLSYVPYAEDLEFAIRLARGSSLAVVETVGYPLHGWASRLGALNLLTGRPTPPLTEPTSTLIDQLTMYANNGFGDDFGKKRARAALTDTRRGGPIDRDLICSALLAAGVSARGVHNLGRLIDHLR